MGSGSGPWRSGCNFVRMFFFPPMSCQLIADDAVSYSLVSAGALAADEEGREALRPDCVEVSAVCRIGQQRAPSTKVTCQSQYL